MPLKQLSCFSRQIQRKIGDIPVLPIAALGEAKGVFRLGFGNVPLEGGGRFILTALGLNGDDLCPVLHYKINLTVFVGIIAGFYLELPPELLQDKVLGQGAFELIIAFQQNCAVVNPRHLLEQSSVKDKELELIQLVKSGKRMLHFGDIVDPAQHPGRDEPFYRFLEISGPAPSPDSAVHELFIGFCKLGNDTAEDHQNAPTVDLAVVLGEVVLIYLDQLALDLGHLRACLKIVNTSKQALAGSLYLI